MIEGHVTAERDAVVALRVRGPQGVEAEVEAVLDTGFTDFLGLAPGLVDRLGLPFFSSADALLADGRLMRFALHLGRVWWEDDWREVVVTATEGGPLLGAGLLYGHLVTLEVVDGGRVLIEAM